MPLYSQLPSELNSVDVVIVGGGSAGCIVASRLSDACSELSILLIEQGSDNYGDPTVIHPAMYVAHLDPSSPKINFVKSRKSAALADRETYTPVGRILGGGSSVNMLMYSRPQRSDLEAWKAPGWSADEMLQQMKKIETFHVQGTQDQHGFQGPIHVSPGPHTSRHLDDAFMEAVGEVGYSEIPDLADLNTNNGVQRALRYVSPEGVRQDTASCYLHPRLRDDRHPKLHVLVESQVSKVLFNEDKQASGVLYAAHSSSELHRVDARKAVILCSGTLGTPAILERSGIGDAKVLKAAGVDLLVDLPGVGSGYEDHQVCSAPYHTSLGVQDTFDGFVNGNFDVPAMMKSNSKLLGWNGLDVTGKLRPTPADIASLGPHFKAHWDKEFAKNENKPLLGLTLIAANADPFNAPPGQYFSVSTFNLYPSSRGYVHVTGPALEDELDFDAAFFTDPHGIDIKISLWGYKKQREIARRTSVFRGEVASMHPPFPASSKAACVESDGPLEDVTDIEYSAEDDAIILQWLRENIATTWHPVATCKMLPREENGVVDTELGVYGVTRLGIADLSIVPCNVGAHTNNLAMTIGEKAAEIFAQKITG